MADGQFTAAMTIVGDKLKFSDLIAKMARVDFSPIVRYLQRKDKNHWTEEKALSELENFKVFLALCGIAGFPVVPTKDIDEVWHACILHTSFYMRLCNLLFGKYIHHRPSDGTKKVKRNNRRNFKQTAVLFKKLSGLDAYPEVKHKDGNCHSGCNCSNVAAKKVVVCDADCAPMVQEITGCDIDDDYDVSCNCLGNCDCGQFAEAVLHSKCDSNRCAATVVAVNLLQPVPAAVDVAHK